METIKIDWKDKKILEELDKNSRQTASQIARKIKLSKQLVNYRINQLLEKKIIKQFITYIDTESLGYSFYDVFFKLKYIPNKEVEEYISKIKKIKGVGWFISTRGESQLCVCIIAKNPTEFDHILQEILKILKDKLISYDFFIVVNATQLAYKNIYNEKNKYCNPTRYGGEFKKTLLNDLKVLEILSKNARLNNQEISNQTGLTIDKVRYSIKKMEKDEIIQSYKPLLNTNKLKLSWNIILIQYNYCTEKQKKDFLNFLKNSKETFYLVNGSGNWSLMIETQTKSLEEFEKFQKNISQNYGSLIRDEKILQISEEHKCTFFPEQIIV